MNSIVQKTGIINFINNEGFEFLLHSMKIFNQTLEIQKNILKILSFILKYGQEIKEDYTVILEKNGWVDYLELL